jgi:hypothetical protein
VGRLVLPGGGKKFVEHWDPLDGFLPEGVATIILLRFFIKILKTVRNLAEVISFGGFPINIIGVVYLIFESFYHEVIICVLEKASERRRLFQEKGFFDKIIEIFVLRWFEIFCIAVVRHLF